MVSHTTSADSRAPHLPLLVDLRGRRAVVVGAGPIGVRRAGSLLDAGAEVTVVDPVPSVHAEALARRGARLVARGYEGREDLEGAMIAVAATGNPQVDGAVRRDADASGILCNVAADADACSVVFPSLLRRGPIVVAASTGGASPAVAARLRDHLARAVGEEWGALVELLGELRPGLRDRYPDSVDRRAAVDRLMDTDVMALLAADDTAGARRLAHTTLGIGR